MKQTLLLLYILSVTIYTIVSASTIVEFYANKDAQITYSGCGQSNCQTTNYGTQDTMEMKWNNDLKSRALLSFNFEIPPGAYIANVWLHLNSPIANTAKQQFVDVHQIVNNNWIENQVTWKDQPDHDDLKIAAVDLITKNPIEVTDAVLSVQNGNSFNIGFKLLSSAEADTTRPDSYVILPTRESDLVSQSSYLKVTYEMNLYECDYGDMKLPGKVLNYIMDSDNETLIAVTQREQNYTLFRLSADGSNVLWSLNGVSDGESDLEVSLQVRNGFVYVGIFYDTSVTFSSGNETAFDSQSSSKSGVIVKLNLLSGEVVQVYEAETPLQRALKFDVTLAGDLIVAGFPSEQKQQFFGCGNVGTIDTSKSMLLARIRGASCIWVQSSDAVDIEINGRDEMSIERTSNTLSKRFLSDGTVSTSSAVTIDTSAKMKFSLSSGGIYIYSNSGKLTLSKKTYQAPYVAFVTNNFNLIWGMKMSGDVDSVSESDGTYHYALADNKIVRIRYDGIELISTVFTPDPQNMTPFSNLKVSNKGRGIFLREYYTPSVKTHVREFTREFTSCSYTDPSDEVVLARPTEESSGSDRQILFSICSLVLISIISVIAIL
jgi:hypothetical protein